MSRVTSSSSGGLVRIADSDGNDITSTGGALNVNLASGGSNIVSGYTYNEITNVPVGLESTIVSYTVISTNPVYLQSVISSGQNIGEIIVYLNNVIIDKNYLYYTGFNVGFDYKTAMSGAPGLALANGDVVDIKGLNNSQGVCKFNARIQTVEVVM